MGRNREHFLSSKCGADTIDVTSKPANDYDPQYAEAAQAA